MENCKKNCEEKMKHKIFILFIYCASLSCNEPTLVTPDISSAITWIPSGGRFGDNLLSYARAKWISYKYDIPVIYLPFTYSDQLVLHEQENIYTPESAQLFSTITHLPLSSDYSLQNNSDTLYISHWKTDVVIDWFDTIFVKELKQKIAPLYELNKVIIPDDCISIAVHVRNGGGFVVDTAQEKERCPLRFVPDEFFIAQVQRLTEMFRTENLYVHIFTDHAEPAVLMKKFSDALNNPRVTFGYREQDNSHNANVLEDFFSMMEFDCLVRPGSHFSRFVQRLGKNKVVIYPESVCRNADGTRTIDVINIKTRANEHERWKTKKVYLNCASQKARYQKMLSWYQQNHDRHTQSHDE